MRALGSLLRILALPLAAGFVGAGAFLDASGIEVQERNRGMMLVLSGLVVAAVTLALLVMLETSFRAVVRALAGTARRPTTAVVITIMVCGTVCILAAVALQWYRPTIPAGLGRGPLLPALTTVTVLLVGVSLLAVGVWSGIPSAVETAPPPPADLPPSGV
jgi:hypothetical protein